MRALIVDDERNGRESLKLLLEKYCDGVEIAAMAENAEQAYICIQETQPDIVFLDIEMPNGNGFTLLERFNDIQFQIVFTTAYDQYAIRAIKFHALDYLLKPIDVDELRDAIAKAKAEVPNERKLAQYKNLATDHKAEKLSRLALPIKEGIVYIQLNEIIRIESDGSYSMFYTDEGKKYVVSKNLKEYEEVLPEKDFFRTHKSHVINMSKVKKFIRTDGFFAEMVDGARVEIARRKKDEFLEFMNLID